MGKNGFVVRSWQLFFIGACLLFLQAPQLRAQVDTGTILGTVKDQTGAVIPDANVTITNDATNYRRSTKTSRTGSYVFTPIGIGTYTVTATAPGFKKIIQRHVTVNIQNQVLVNLTLVPGEVTESVQVSGRPPLLQTQSASVQQTISSRALENLPLINQNPLFLARIVPGASAGGGAGRGLTQHGNFKVNGMPSLMNNEMIDGIDNNAEIGDLVNQSTYAVMPPPDALSQITLQTNNYSAQFGHTAGAVVNATTKSGTNHLHGDLWEFVRNDKFDAADFFLNSAGAKKSEYRRNDFGFTLGGPVVIPHLYNGHNKTFFFADYEGVRTRQGSGGFTTVPTAAERASGYTDFQDLIAYQSGTRHDLLGRTFPRGTIMDPATTRPVTAGQVDPVTGLMATANGYVRDPFYEGSLTGVTNFMSPTAEGLLNIIPASRLDPNAIKLLNLYPSPTFPGAGLTGGLGDNFITRQVDADNSNEFGARVDHNFSAKDTMFVRYYLSKETSAYPGPFPGLADGEGARPGSGTTKAQNWALSETHIFSSNLVNEARIGYSRLHDVRLQVGGNQMGIPEQFGIQGVPQVPENGGLPQMIISGLHTIGTPNSLPSNKWSNTIQLKDDLTKMVGRHTIKAGIEFQNIRSPEFTPPHSRGVFHYNGVFTSVVNENDGSTGRAMFLLTPMAATVPGGINNVGGMNNLSATNIAPFADLRHNYYGLYIQDDWRTTSKLTLNLGLRWEHFGWPTEIHNAIGNFVPNLNFQGGTFYFSKSRMGELPQGYIDQLALDGIKVTPVNGHVASNVSGKDFGPRFGFAYRATSNLVVRGGYAIFYGANFSGNAIFNTFPYIIRNSFGIPDPFTPITSDNSIGLLENGLLNVPLNAATATNFSGIVLQGEQKNWKDPSIQNYNFTLEYQFRKNTTVTAGYVGSQTRHLPADLPTNSIANILPPGTNIFQNSFYPDLPQGGQYYQPRGNANYNSLQLNFMHQARYLSVLANYTWDKCLSTTGQVLINGAGFGAAPYLDGFRNRYSYCDTDDIINLSGVYDLPFGQGRHFLNESGIVNALAGGWRASWIVTVHSGGHFGVGCTIATNAGLGCTSLLVPGQDPYTGASLPDHPYLNPAAFTNPPVATTIGQTDFAPLGGVGMALTAPAYFEPDFSFFKNFKTTETTHLQFRADFFNLTNSPSFGGPGPLNFNNTKQFGLVTSTQTSARIIQFGMKLYF